MRINLQFIQLEQSTIMKSMMTQRLFGGVVRSTHILSNTKLIQMLKHSVMLLVVKSKDISKINTGWMSMMVISEL